MEGVSFCNRSRRKGVGIQLAAERGLTHLIQKRFQPACVEEFTTRYQHSCFSLVSQREHEREPREQHENPVDQHCGDRFRVSTKPSHAITTLQLYPNHVIHHNVVVDLQSIGMLVMSPDHS